MKKTILQISHRVLVGLFMVGALISDVNADEPQFNCDSGDYCVDQDSWQFGLALGIGGRVNPLVDGDNIPFVILPDIAYYGESFYFDNGELGTQFFPSNNTSLDLYIAANSERAYFTFWHPSNILIPAASFGLSEQVSASAGLTDDVQISIDNVSTRKWAVDAGIRWQWHVQHHQIRLSLASDVSNVHHGAHALAEYDYHFYLDNWRVSAAMHIKWMSANLTDYYYGITRDDTPIPELIYEAEQGIQYGISLNVAYPINEQWQWLGKASYTTLHRGMSNSPLVEKSYVVSAFVGVAYRF